MQEMVILRRIKILVGFLFVWGLVIVTQLANFAFLGYQDGRDSHFFLALDVALIGISCQILFQGQSRLEVLESQRLKGKISNCAIDRVYSRFAIDRTVRIVAVGLLFGAISLWTNLFYTKGSYLLVGIILSSVAVIVLRTVVIYRRVTSGYFGSNEYEARELLSFLNKLYQDAPKDFDPPGGMGRYNETVDRVVIASGAEYAL